MATLNFNTTVTDWTTNSGSATAVPNSIPKTQFESMLTELVPTTNFLDRSIVVNESGNAAHDFRVESDANTSMLVVDASANGVGIGGSASSTYNLKVTGKAQILGDGTGSTNTELRVEDTAAKAQTVMYGETGVYQHMSTETGDARLALIWGRSGTGQTSNAFDVRNDGTNTDICLYDYNSGFATDPTSTPIQINNATGHVGIGGLADAGTTTSSYELTVHGNSRIYNDGKDETGTGNGGTELYVLSTVYASTTLASDYTHGTDTTITLTDASNFNDSGYGNIGGDVFYWISKNGNVLTLRTMQSSGNQDGDFYGSKTAGAEVQAGGGSATVNASSNALYGYGQFYAQGEGGARLDLVDTGISQSTNERTTLLNAGGVTAFDIYDENANKKFDGFQLNQTTGNWSFGDRANLTVTQNDSGTTAHIHGQPSVGVGRSTRAAFRGPSATASQSLEATYVVSSGTCTVTFSDVVTDIQPYDRVYINETGAGTLADGYYTVLTTAPSGIGINGFTFSTSAADQSSVTCEVTKSLFTADFHVGMGWPSTLINMSGGLSSTATTMVVDSTYKFPDQGCLQLSGDEIVSYSGKTATSFTGLTRGVQGTTAVAHNDNTTVYTTKLDKNRHYGWMYADKGINFAAGTTFGSATSCCDTDSPYSDLMKGVADAHTRISQAVSASDTTINVDSTTGFATSGTVIIDSETITYTGTTATSFTGCTRSTTSVPAGDYPVDTLVIKSISTSMGFIDATSQGHFVAAIRGNDAGDGFHILGSLSGETSSSWESKVDDAGARSNWENTPFSILKATHRGVTINEHSQNMDFRVESEDNQFMLHMPAAHNAVGIGCNPSTEAAGYQLVVKGSQYIAGDGGPSGTELNIVDQSASAKVNIYGTTGANIVIQDATNTGQEVDSGGSTLNWSGNDRQSFRLRNYQGHMRFETTTNTQSTVTAAFGRWYRPRDGSNDADAKYFAASGYTSVSSNSTTRQVSSQLVVGGTGAGHNAYYQNGSAPATLIVTNNTAHAGHEEADQTSGHGVGLLVENVKPWTATTDATDNCNIILKGNGTAVQQWYDTSRGGNNSAEDAVNFHLAGGKFAIGAPAVGGTTHSGDIHNNILQFDIDTGHIQQRCRDVAPADSLLNNNQITFYLDGSTLKAKIRNASGTVSTHTLS